MKRTRTILSAVLGAAIALGVAAGPAGADPKQGDTFLLHCDRGLGTLPIVVNGNGEWTPGHVTTSTQVVIPYRLDISGSFTPADGGPTETFVELSSKRAPRNGRLAECSFHVEGTDEFGTFEYGGTVLVSYTPTR